MDELLPRPDDAPAPGSSRRLSPGEYAIAYASWQDESPVPPPTENCLTLPLLTLPGLSTVRRLARGFLSASLVDADGAGAEALTNTVIVVDELTSNALRHGRQPSSLHIYDDVDRRLLLVTDAATQLAPTPALDRPDGQGGYGLYIIADLTGAHGVHYADEHKTVWACVEKP